MFFFTFLFFFKAFYWLKYRRSKMKDKMAGFLQVRGGGLETAGFFFFLGTEMRQGPVCDLSPACAHPTPVLIAGVGGLRRADTTPAG